MSIISVKNLEKRFGENVILKNVNTEVEKGEVISIIGPSGTGKSTLLRAINFLDPPTGGEVFFDGEKVTKKNVDTVRRRMGMVFQNFGLFSHMDVVGNLTAGPIKLLGTPKREAEEKAFQLLKTVGLAERARFFPRQLSGGQKQRVAIARALINKPSIILADEPTGNLDRKTADDIMRVLADVNKLGNTILLVTHEPRYTKMATRQLFIEEGRLIH